MPRRRGFLVDRAERDNGTSAALDAEETVHVTASRWWQRRKAELAPNTLLDYRWRLDHVLRHLAHDTTAELDAHRVDAVRGELEATGLSPCSVNMMLDLLAQILDDAVEFGLLTANPARGKRRRVKVPKPARTFLEPDGRSLPSCTDGALCAASRSPVAVPTSEGCG